MFANFNGNFNQLQLPVIHSGRNGAHAQEPVAREALPGPEDARALVIFVS